MSKLCKNLVNDETVSTKDNKPKYILWDRGCSAEIISSSKLCNLSDLIFVDNICSVIGYLAEMANYMYHKVATYVQEGGENVHDVFIFRIAMCTSVYSNSVFVILQCSKLCLWFRL